MGKAVPKDEVCINGRFVYATNHKPLTAGHARTDEYIDDIIRLDARSCVKGFPEAIYGVALPPQQKSYRF